MVKRVVLMVFLSSILLLNFYIRDVYSANTDNAEVRAYGDQAILNPGYTFGPINRNKVAINPERGGKARSELSCGCTQQGNCKLEVDREVGIARCVDDKSSNNRCRLDRDCEFSYLKVQTKGSRKGR